MGPDEASTVPHESAYSCALQCTPGGIVATKRVGSEASLTRSTQQRYHAGAYRVALAQQFTDHVNAYASFNRCFESGSYDLSTPLNVPYEPQYSRASASMAKLTMCR